MTAVDALPALLESRFPVAVTLPDGSRHATVLVVWTSDGRVVVFTHPNTVVLDAPWVPASSWAGSRGVDWQIATEVGVLVVHPGRGCGCGNPLKSASHGVSRRVGASVVKTIRAAQESAGGAA